MRHAYRFARRMFSQRLSWQGFGSVAGLALVFSDGNEQTTPNAPSTLNLSAHTTDTHTPFTLPSTLLAPLHQSIQTINNERYEKIAQRIYTLRAALN
jgi:aspartate aminotransferase-like enzyme